MPAVISTREEEHEMQRVVCAAGFIGLVQATLSETQHDASFGRLLIAEHAYLIEGAAAKVGGIHTLVG
jgi:hypothetical protein